MAKAKKNIEYYQREEEVEEHEALDADVEDIVEAPLDEEE